MTKGFQQLPNWFVDEYLHKLTPIAIKIYLNLNRLGFDGQDYVKIKHERLAEKMNCTARNITRGIAELKKYMLVLVIECKTKKGRRLVFQFLFWLGLVLGIWDSVSVHVVA